jgi:hypothetical protein
MTDHSWRSYLTPDQGADLLATEAYERFAKAAATNAWRVKTQRFWQREANTARLKINRIREGAIQRMHATQVTEGVHR